MKGEFHKPATVLWMSNKRILLDLYLKTMPL